MTGDLMAVSRRGDERLTLLAASHCRVPRRRAVSPRFEDAELERRFRRSFDAAALPLVRMGTALGVLLTIIFGALDVWVVGDDLIAALVVHGAVAAILVGCLWAQRRPWWLAIQRFVGAAAVVLAALAFDLMTVVSPTPQGVAALTMIMPLVFLCNLIRTTVGLAAGGSVVMVVRYLAATLASGKELGSLCYYLPSLNAFLSASHVGCYIIELGTRCLYFSM